jgi:hypothetical protein
MRYVLYSDRFCSDRFSKRYILSSDMFNIAIPIIPIGFIAETFYIDRFCSDRFHTDTFHTDMFCLCTVCSAVSLTSVGSYIGFVLMNCLLPPLADVLFLFAGLPVSVRNLYLEQKKNIIFSFYNSVHGVFYNNIHGGVLSKILKNFKRRASIYNSAILCKYDFFL